MLLVSFPTNFLTQPNLCFQLSCSDVTVIIQDIFFKKKGLGWLHPFFDTITRMPIRFRILIQNCFSIEWRENKNTILSLSMGGAFAVDCPCFVLTRRQIMPISFCHHHVINQAQRKKDFHAERNSRCSGWPANELRYGRMLALQCAGGNLPPSGQISFILHGCFAIIFIYTGEKVKICCVDRAGNHLLWNTHQWLVHTSDFVSRVAEKR